MPDRMHRQLRHLLALLLHHQRFPFFVKITALRGDVECVLQFAHICKIPLILTALSFENGSPFRPSEK